MAPKSEYAIITVTCDRCSQARNVPVTSIDQSEEQDNLDLIKAGWRVDSNFINPTTTSDICPACVQAIAESLKEPEHQLDLFDNTDEQPWL